MQPSVFLLLSLPLIASGDIFFAIDNENHPRRGRLCLSNDPNQNLAPIYDLGIISSDLLLPSKPQGWISELDIKSGFDTNFEVLSAWDFYRWREMPQLVMKGDGSITKLPFDLHTASEQQGFSFSLLAEYATLLMTRTELGTAPGYVLQFDYYNRTTESKELKMLKCDDARVHDKNCNLVFKKEVSLLDNGNSWTHFKLHLYTISSVNYFTVSKRNSSPISWIDAAPNAHYHDIRFLAVSNANRPGIIKLHAVPFLKPVNTQEFSPNFALSIKGYQITKDAMIGIDVFWKETNSDNVKLYTYGTTWQEIDCKNVGKRTTCETQILKSGIYQVRVQFVNPGIILFIMNFSNRTNKISLRISQAEDGSWFKGCQTLPAADWKKEEIFVSRSNCVFKSFKDTSIICDILQKQTLQSCQSLDFCTLPSNAINSSNLDTTTTTVSDISKAHIWPQLNQTIETTGANKNSVCKCWSDQLPFVKHLLWTMLCANLVMFVIVSLRWRPLLKQRQCAAQQEVSKRPRLPEPQQIASKSATPLR